MKFSLTSGTEDPTEYYISCGRISRNKRFTIEILILMHNMDANK